MYEIEIYLNGSWHLFYIKSEENLNYFLIDLKEDDEFNQLLVKVNGHIKNG